MIKRIVGDLLEGTVSLLYPTLCISCQRGIRAATSPPLCVACYTDLAFTGYEELPENEVTDRFAGRLPLAFGTGLLHFRTGTVCQSLIHALKYHRRREVGVQLGKMLGERLTGHPGLAELVGLVPVPIHPARRRKRGYNQAEVIAEGMAGRMDVPVLNDALRRADFKKSQTKLSSMDRVRNVEHTFVAGPEAPEEGLVLIVDDVITTGATLDYCGHALLEAKPDLKIGVASLAVAQL